MINVLFYLVFFPSEIEFIICLCESGHDEYLYFKLFCIVFSKWLLFTCIDFPVMVKNVSMANWSCFWCSLSNLNDDNCEGFIFLGLGLQAIFLALMRMVRNRGSKWKTCFSLYFQHYLMRFCYVLRFLLCLSALLYASCGMLTWSWLKYEFLCQFVVSRLHFFLCIYQPFCAWSNTSY